MTSAPALRRSRSAKAVSMPRTFGDAILTSAKAIGPGTSAAEVAAVLRTLPGVLQVATLPGQAVAYRHTAMEA